MIVYVESNFPLELARQQEESPRAEELLRMAQGGRIGLVFPVFAVCEPFSALGQYAAERGRLVSAQRPQIRELGRSLPHQALAVALKDAEDALLGVWRTEMNGLEGAVRRMLAAGRAIPLTPEIFSRSIEIADRLGMATQDAIVLASVLADLAAQPPNERKCFVSRNTKDFDDPTVKSELAGYSCAYVSAFGDAVSLATASFGESL